MWPSQPIPHCETCACWDDEIDYYTDLKQSAIALVKLHHWQDAFRRVGADEKGEIKLPFCPCGSDNVVPISALVDWGDGQHVLAWCMRCDAERELVFDEERRWSAVDASASFPKDKGGG